MTVQEITLIWAVVASTVSSLLLIKYLEFIKDIDCLEKNNTRLKNTIETLNEENNELHDKLIVKEQVGELVEEIIKICSKGTEPIPSKDSFEYC